MADRRGADIPQLYPPRPEIFALKCIEPLTTELLDRRLRAGILKTLFDLPEALSFIDRADDATQCEHILAKHIGFRIS